jgi:hypothetical protein
MIHRKSVQSNGYVLLLSVIFLGAIAVTIAGSLLFLGLSRGQTDFTALQAAQARALSEACAETALTNLQENSSYAGGETIILNNGNTCNILPVEFNAPVYTFNTEATVGSAVKKLSVQAEVQTATNSSSTLVHLDSWSEQ